VWFIDGDFPFVAPAGSAKWVGLVLVVVLALQAIKEAVTLVRAHVFNIPKNLMIWGTALAWYVGIVHFDGDVPFTVTNVVAHGVPYMALVWIFGRRKHEKSPAPPASLLARCFTAPGAALFLAALVCLAFTEEALWDALIWRDRKAFFGWAWVFPPIKDDKVLALLVPLLAVPQATHYVLDAFIWRIRKPSSEVNHLLLRDRH